MKNDRFANGKLRMRRATLLHFTPGVLEFQATQECIAPTLKLVGARVEMLHDLSCLMSNRKHVSTKLKKLHLGNKSHVVATVERLAFGTRVSPSSKKTYTNRKHTKSWFHRASQLICAWSFFFSVLYVIASHDHDNA